MARAKKGVESRSADTALLPSNIASDPALLEDLVQGEMVDALKDPVFSLDRTPGEISDVLNRLVAAPELYVLFPYDKPRASRGWLALQRPPDAANSDVLAYRDGVMLIKLPQDLYDTDMSAGKERMVLAQAVKRQLTEVGDRVLLPGFFEGLGKTLGKPVTPYCYRVLSEERGTIFTARWPVLGQARRGMYGVPVEEAQDVSDASTRSKLLYDG
jgi:hypothetical protein